MKKLYTAAAAAAVLAFSGAAFAQTEAAPAQAEQPASPSSFTDAQLQSFAAASIEIDPISRSLQGATPEAQATAATQIRAILASNNLDSDTYNSIAAAAQADPALAQRIASLQTSGSGGASASVESSGGADGASQE